MTTDIHIGRRGLYWYVGVMGGRCEGTDPDLYGYVWGDGSVHSHCDIDTLDGFFTTREEAELAACRHVLIRQEFSDLYRPENRK